MIVDVETTVNAQGAHNLIYSYLQLLQKALNDLAVNLSPELAREKNETLRAITKLSDNLVIDGLQVYETEDTTRALAVFSQELKNKFVTWNSPLLHFYIDYLVLGSIGDFSVNFKAELSPVGQVFLAEIVSQSWVETFLLEEFSQTDKEQLPVVGRVILGYSIVALKGLYETYKPSLLEPDNDSADSEQVWGQILNSIKAQHSKRLNALGFMP